MSSPARIPFLFCLLLVAVSLRSGAAVAAPPTVAGSAPMITPRDFFADLPAMDFGMSFADAKKAIEKTGASPVDGTRTGGELVWDGQFAGTAGRATTLYKPDKGLWEVAVVVYAMDKREAIFNQWSKTIADRHGPATEKADDEETLSRVWRFKSGFVLELRLSLDANNPSVDIHWVKE